MATVVRSATSGARRPRAGPGKANARLGIDSPRTGTTGTRREAPPPAEAKSVNLPVLVPGILIAAAGAGVLLFPVRFTDFTRDLLARPAAKWYAGGIRIVLGALIFAGSESASRPAAVAAVGALLLFVGAVLLLLPRPRFEALARWGVGLPPATLRLAAAAAIGLGVWLAFEAAGGTPA